MLLELFKKSNWLLLLIVFIVGLILLTVIGGSSNMKELFISVQSLGFQYSLKK
jgi:hypothetical protein